jgi:hypothetical protein
MKRMLKRVFKEIRLFVTRIPLNKFKGINSLDSLQPEKMDLNETHLFFHKYYWNNSPTYLKKHRSYFSKNRRSFGEDAFHAMWLFLFEKYKPSNVLEIGVYRGSTLTLFGLLSKKLNFKCEVHGISPFEPVGDSVSDYLKNLDYQKEVLSNITRFELNNIYLHKGLSTDASMVDFITSRTWGLIFIDGNHDYEVVHHDFTICSSQLKKGGLVILDDSSRYTDFKAPFYSFEGHDGPSRVADSIKSKDFREILSVGHNRVFMKV